MKEVTEELKYVHKAAALGCYYNECWHQGAMVATVGYNGITVFDKNYRHTEETDGKTTIVRIFQINEIEPQVPLD